jgi:hypothetical protein
LRDMPSIDFAVYIDALLRRNGDGGEARPAGDLIAKGISPPRRMRRIAAKNASISRSGGVFGKAESRFAPENARRYDLVRQLVAVREPLPQLRHGHAPA